MAGNRLSSRGLPTGAPQRGHGGTLHVQFANTELPVSRQYETYNLEGSGQITNLTPLPLSFKFEIVIKSGSPTFINSARLICPGGVNYVGAVGDLIILRSDGDGVWRLFAIPSSSMVPSASPTFTGTLSAAAINVSGILAVSNSTASTSTTTGAETIAGGLGIAGQASADHFSAFGTPSSTWDFDTGGRAGITLANNATYALPANSSGLLALRFGSGGGGVVWVSGGIPGIIYSSGGSVTTTQGNSGTTNVYYDFGTAKYTIENKTGSTETMYLMSFRFCPTP